MCGARSERYTVLEDIGEGTFGTVHKALDKDTGRFVALKRVSAGRGGGRQSFSSESATVPIGAFRELQALRLLSGGANVVQIYEGFAWGTNVCLVLELASTDLKSLLDKRGRGLPLAERCVKHILQQAGRALAFCHARGIMHRDIKPGNLLVWPEDGRIKLADFGLARSFKDAGVLCREEKRVFSHQVATRWYRAPELLFGARDYSEKVDIFALGCIAGELLVGAPLFPGENDIDQIYRVMQVLGTPPPQGWLHFPDTDKIQFGEMASTLDQVVSPAPFTEECKKLAKNCLVYNPTMRCSAVDFLSNEAFVKRPWPRWV